MDWQAALLKRLRTAVAKSYWERAPQGTSLPYVTLFEVPREIAQNLKDWDLESARVQVDVWAKTYPDRQQLRQAVLDTLVPAYSGDGHQFQRAIVELAGGSAGERDGTEPIFRWRADLILHHTTTA